jgi:hypothetical protein
MAQFLRVKIFSRINSTWINLLKILLTSQNQFMKAEAKSPKQSNVLEISSLLAIALMHFWILDHHFLKLERWLVMRCTVVTMFLVAVSSLELGRLTGKSSLLFVLTL